MRLSPDEFEKKLASVPDVEPDAEDIEAIKAIDRTETGGVELDEFMKKLDYSGKISLRIPKTLHRELVEQAKREGVSLNQYALYKLSRPTNQAGQ